MYICYQLVILACVFGNLYCKTKQSILDNHCNATSTMENYGIFVTDEPPSPTNGTVVVKASLNNLRDITNTMCSWTYVIHKIPITRQGLLFSASSIPWTFSRPGPQKVLVTASFHVQRQEIIKNCTFVNVTDCAISPRVLVSTSAGLYNISMNHTDVIMNSPGSANFSLSVMKMDPYFVCQRLYFVWKFSDAHSASGKRVERYYNKTGDYVVVLSIYKRSEREFSKNVTINVHVKENFAPKKSDNTAMDVSLVLVIFFVCFVFVICMVGYWFRKRLHRHTEVAAFDFRAAELQSSYLEDHRQNAKVGCLNTAFCRRGSNERLLIFSEGIGHYSSCRRFDGRCVNESL